MDCTHSGLFSRHRLGHIATTLSCPSRQMSKHTPLPLSYFRRAHTHTHKCRLNEVPTNGFNTIDDATTLARQHTPTLHNRFPIQRWYYIPRRLVQCRALEQKDWLDPQVFVQTGVCSKQHEDVEAMCQNDARNAEQRKAVRQRRD